MTAHPRPTHEKNPNSRRVLGLIAASPVFGQMELSFVRTYYTQGKVFIVSRAGKIEWEYDGATNCNDVQVLPGGNLLFNTGHGVREVARDKTVVFDYEPTIAY